MDIHVKFGILRRTWAELFDSLPVGPVLRTYNAVFNFSLQPNESVSHVMSGRYMRLTVPNKCVQLCDPSLNRSGEI